MATLSPSPIVLGITSRICKKEKKNLTRIYKNSFLTYNRNKGGLGKVIQLPTCHKAPQGTSGRQS